MNKVFVGGLFTGNLEEKFNHIRCLKGLIQTIYAKGFENTQDGPNELIYDEVYSAVSFLYWLEDKPAHPNTISECITEARSAIIFFSQTLSEFDDLQLAGALVSLQNKGELLEKDGLFYPDKNSMKYKLCAKFFSEQRKRDERPPVTTIPTPFDTDKYKYIWTHEFNKTYTHKLSKKDPKPAKFLTYKPQKPYSFSARGRRW